MTDFRPYQRQHLFLLVGGNTLPNYVSARLLAVAQGNLYLIHSSGTQTQASNLEQQLLQDGYQVELRSLQDADSNAYKIRELVRGILAQIPTDESIGLNYTGGTKAMSVHAYIAFGRAKRQTLFTYLNPRDRAIMVDHANNPAEKLPISAQDISLSLQTLFQLHNTPLADETPNSAHLPQLSGLLAQICSSAQTSTQWRNWWYQSTLRYAEDRIFRDFIDLSRLPLKLVEFIRDRLSNRNSRVKSAYLAQNLGFRSVIEMSNWFGGLWLEHYTLACIKTLVDSHGIADVGRNFKLSVDGTYGFEFDVAFTRCYQLYALSCTTSERRKLCKQKLLEAAHRAQQMGGSEAKVALVCCNLDPESLKAELSTLPNPVKVKVFSLRTTVNLTGEISNWIAEDIINDLDF
ncbi:Card1-like endonuclease domain-containing protein [Lyngbya confervoides]|uniref:DUF1887 family CARF protein n=1 Tax=Lyngbya confervoides BDU141951 TaxID=1574623 RepID=A0ABD4T692_9CYAN|nr:DUF1887 family CARF protein [Lyngbya confervoides]MCM1983755.1 DUF1887 family CARF protein [Lyngbya confervoides BDU141951]